MKQLNKKIINSRNEEENNENLTISKKIKLIFENITVEPVMILYVLPNVMSSLAVQNLSLEKACRVNLHFKNYICDALADRNVTSYKSEEIKVQKLVATAMAWKNLVQSLLPSIVLLFLGSWSDRHNRRKPCILFPIVGEIFSVIGFIICTYYFYELSLIYNVLSEAIPPAITGGWFALFMGVFSYISSISTVDDRTLRIGAVNMFSNISVTVGIALSGILYKKIGFYGVFFLALNMYISAFVYGLFRLKEFSDQNNKFDSSKEKKFIADFFDIRHVRATINVAFKNGENNRRKKIIIIMVLVMVIIGPVHGEMNVMYLFVRLKFNWNEMNYSIYSTFNFLVHMLGTLFSLIVFSKYFKMDDALLGMISSSSKIASSFVYAFAPNAKIFYLGAVVEMLNGTSFIAMRSIISKLVPPDELGKIYSIFGVSEALMPLVYGPMYSAIYRNTIDSLPGAFFLTGGILTAPAVIIFLWLYFERKKDEKELLQYKEQTEKLLNDDKQNYIKSNISKEINDEIFLNK